MHEYKTKVSKIKKISTSVYLYELDKPLGFSFVPGQFVSVRVATNILRSYSIASCTTESNLTLLIDLSPMGVGCTYFSRLKKGQSIVFIGPLGNLVLPKEIPKSNTINFISTGTGIAPYLSMLSGLSRSNFKGNINVLHSEKYSNDFYDFKFKNLNLTKKITLTREKNPKFYYGRVTKFIDKNFIIPNSLYYLCGNKNMINTASKLLLNNGIDKGNIRKEIFY